MKGFKIIVLAKQVPDTRNVSKDAMKEDGTMNRAALPAIFNPEDLNALEQALRIKDKYPQSTITILTMGLPKAADIVREGLFRGADNGVLLTDRKLGGSDTLATSYAISQAIKTIGNFDIILCGRQAIDGDTAQVGPQAAEKLNIPQVTYAEQIIDINEKNITIRRRLEHGVETICSSFPLLITVHGSAAPCRSRNAKLTMKYKYAKTPDEIVQTGVDAELYKNKPYLNIKVWSADDINADEQRLGLSGSPTKVKKIEMVVLQTKESKKLSSNDSDIKMLMGELSEKHVI
ncbi:MAG: electron transfer flavoprotein subunit beta/FixA family protein [Bacteroidales bacterium]|nr:electron transfer flavoprotein subunit beta/FixA family protein [Bacteroidales bacterium]